jgi:predicted PurR-regulated permease PerM
MIADTFRLLWNTIVLRVVFLVACGYLVFVVLRLTSIAWVSFLVAFLIAYLVEPFVIRLERRRVPRWLSMSCVMVFIVFLVLLSVFVAGDILVRLVSLPRVLVPFLEELPTRLESLSPPWLRMLFDDNTDALRTFLETQRSTLLGWLQLQTRSLWRDIGIVFGVLGNIVVILFLTAFMIASYPAIRKSLLNIVPVRHSHTAEDLTAKLDSSVGGYIRAQTWRSVIVGLVLWLVFALTGVPKAGALAFFSALLNPIPYLGNVIATVPAVLLAFTVGWQLALVTLVVCILVQVLDGNILQSLVFSQSLDVNPVTVILALLVGGSLGGFWGLMLAIPLAAFLQLLYRDYYLQSKWYRSTTNPRQRKNQDPHLPQTREKEKV